MRACLGSFGLQGKVASETPLVQLSGGQKVSTWLDLPSCNMIVAHHFSQPQVRLAFALIVFKPPALL